MFSLLRHVTHSAYDAVQSTVPAEIFCMVVALFFV